jgi:hypothetical protein
LIQCTVPVAPLSPEIAAEGFGRDDLRLAYYDCTQAWLYPSGGRSVGWYAFFRGEETDVDFVWAHRELARTAYEQRLPREVPSFTIDEWLPGPSNNPIEGLQSDPVTVAPSDWPPEQAEREGKRVAPPLSLSGPLEFLGYRLQTETASPGETLEVWTYWSVTTVPEHLLSLMGHLLDGEGRAVAVSDGLGVPVESWLVDDVIVQRHMLEIPPDLTPGTYWLQSGAYALTDLRRLDVLVGGQPVGDRIVLSPVQVVER